MLLIIFKENPATFSYFSPPYFTSLHPHKTIPTILPTLPSSISMPISSPYLFIQLFRKSQPKVLSPTKDI